MTDNETLYAVAAELYAAEAEGSAIEPIAQRYPNFGIPDSYAIQSINIARKRDAGAKVIGHKIGLTSLAMQEMMGVNRPDFGYLLDSMVLDATSAVPLSPYIRPRVEPEIAYVLDRELPMTGCTADDVESATAHVIPCLELIDSRIVDWNIGLIDTIADNASSAAIILGNMSIAPEKITSTGSRAEVRIGKKVMATGSTSDVLGHPANAVAWLANALGEFGVRLEAGHIILSGSCTRAIDVAAGDTITAEFDNLGAIEVTFT